MSFFKITDPTRRRELVDRYLKAKQKIKNDLIQEKTGEIDFQSQIQKFIDPIQQIQVEQTKQLTDKIDSTIPMIKSSSNEVPAISKKSTMITIGPIATESLSRVQQDLPYDKVFGVKGNGDFNLGDSEITIEGDDIIFDDGTRFQGTRGLWNLINNPNPKEFEIEDLENYKQIVLKTNLHLKKDGKPKSSRSMKWTEILKPIYLESRASKTRQLNTEKGKQGSSLSPHRSTKTIIIPQDPDALIERLQLLIASKSAGNTGVQNEIVKICDELLRQKQITKTQYKRFFSR